MQTNFLSFHTVALRQTENSGTYTNPLPYKIYTNTQTHTQPHNCNIPLLTISLLHTFSSLTYSANGCPFNFPYKYSLFACVVGCGNILVFVWV